MPTRSTKRSARRSSSREDKPWRLTNQRIVILEYLRSTPGHHNAEDIFKVVKKKMPSMSFATVYRNLNFLTEHGYIQETVINKISHFDGQIDAHVHLLCESCGTVVNVEDTNVFKVARSLAQHHHFKPRVEQIELRGLCADCQQKRTAKDDVSEGRCEACGKLKKDILQSVLMCSDCRFNSSCVYYQEAKAAQRT